MRQGAIRWGCLALAIGLLAASCGRVPAQSGETESRMKETTSAASHQETTGGSAQVGASSAVSTKITAAATSETSRTSAKTTASSVPSPPSSSTGSTAATTTAPADDAPYKAAPAAVFPVADRYGMRGVNIIGDSISHGANAPKIPEQSYVGLFKKAADAEWQGGNYGFVSLLAAIDNASGVYKEIHTISRSGSWQTLQTGDFLGAYAMRSAKQGDTLYIKPKTAFRYAAVFYEASPAGGRFEILVNGKSAGIVDTKAPARDTAARTGLFPLNATAKADIQVVSAGGGTVTVTGVGYYNSRNGVVVNNYSRSGLQLVQIEDDTLRMMCRASVVVFAMGHNDMWQDGIDAAFAHKIYVVMQAVKDSKARLIVSDFTWGDPKGRTVRKELKRLADACGGVYHDYAAEMSHQIQDGSHPYPSGHRILANALWADVNR